MRLAILLLTAMTATAAHADCVARSGASTAVLVELYTSEGCSSCPPADRWLSSVRRTADLVPVAFHVTYWDYIGWRDAYADERHTARQRDRAAASGTRYVYTPQVVVGGRDFRAWSSAAEFRRAVSAINQAPARADIELRMRTAVDGGLRVDATATLKPGIAPADVVLLVAATQDGLSSRVTAGENRGERLAHDFVVRDMAHARAMTVAATFTPRPGWKPEGMSVVAFAQDTRSGEVLQALSAPFCR